MRVLWTVCSVFEELKNEGDLRITNDLNHILLKLTEKRTGRMISYKQAETGTFLKSVKFEKDTVMCDLSCFHPPPLYMAH